MQEGRLFAAGTRTVPLPASADKEATRNDPRGTNVCSKAGSKSMTKKTGNTRSSFFEDLLCFSLTHIDRICRMSCSVRLLFFHTLQDAIGPDGEETESLRKG